MCINIILEVINYKLQFIFTIYNFRISSCGQLTQIMNNKTIKFSLSVQSTMPFKTSSSRLCGLKLLYNILKFLLNYFSSSITSLHGTNDHKNENPLTIKKGSKLNTQCIGVSVQSIRLTISHAMRLIILEISSFNSNTMI